MTPADKIAIAKHFRYLADDHTNWGRWYGSRGNFRQAERHHRAASDYRTLAARCTHYTGPRGLPRSLWRPVALAGTLAATILTAATLSAL